MQVRLVITLNDELTREEADQQWADGDLLEIIDHPHSTVELYYDGVLIDTLEPEDLEDDQEEIDFDE